MMGTLSFFRNRTAILSAILTFAIGAFGGSPLFAERPSVAKLLPEKTIFMVSIPNAQDLVTKFLNTNLGQMGQDPQMKPLIEQLYGSFGELVDQVKDSVGLSLSEFMALPQGEITFAFVNPATDSVKKFGDPPDFVLIFEAGDQLSKARIPLERLMNHLKSNNQSSIREETLKGVKCTIVSNQRGNEELIVFEKDTAIALCLTVEAAKQVLALWVGEKDARSLAENPNFATIMNRCRGTKDEEPQLIWFFDYLSLFKMQAAKNPQLAFFSAMLPALGLDGLKGIGGSVLFDTAQFDTMMHIHLLLESPRSGVVKLIAFESGPTKPEPWVPGDIASYATMNWNFESTLKAGETLFDSFSGKGSFAAMVQANINKSLGADLMQQIVPALDGRVIALSWIEKPITPLSSQSLVAFKLKEKKDGKEDMQKILDGIAKKDPEKITQQIFQGKAYYRFTPRTPSTPMPDGEAPRFPTPCFGIVDQYVVISNAQAIYEQVLTVSEDPTKSLGQELDYKLVASKADRLATGTKPALFQFKRTEESFRFMYDLATGDSVKNWLQKESEHNPFFKSVHSSLEKQPLPPFSVIQKYLAPSGSVVIDDETGVHYVEFTLKRKGD